MIPVRVISLRRGSVNLIYCAIHIHVHCTTIQLVCTVYMYNFFPSYCTLICCCCGLCYFVKKNCFCQLSPQNLEPLSQVSAFSCAIIVR